jgi:archaellum biogenesis ATPase FlaH
MNFGPFLPIKAGQKFPPCLKDWQKASREDLARVMMEHQGANVALRLDNHLALDPDDQAASDFLDTLEQGGRLPPTVAWTTWRKHTVRLYRRADGLQPIKAPAGSPMMLEVRTGAGQYVLIPPSKVNGRSYKYVPHLSPQDIEPAELPPETLALIRKALQKPGSTQETPHSARPSAWTALWQGVPEGSRDDTAAKLAGRLLSRGLPAAEVIEILYAWDARNTPPLGPQDIIKVVNSVAAKDSRRDDALKFITGDDLLDLQLNEPPNILSGGILPARGSLIITGDSGVGKSLLALEIGLCLSHGLNFGDMQVEKPYRVIIFQAENPTHSLQYRLRRIMEGHGLTSSPNLIITDPRLRVSLQNPRDLRKLIGMIEKAQAEIAILDPLSSYHQVNENDNIAIRGVLDNLTAISHETGCAWTVLHHHGKPSKDRKWEFRGASSIRDWCDTMAALIPKPQVDPNKILRLLRFDKVRHGPLRRDLLLERDRFFCHLISEEEWKAPPSLVVEVLKGLGGSARLNDLAKNLGEKAGISPRTAYRAINNAIGRGIRRHGVEGKEWASLSQ